MNSKVNALTCCLETVRLICVLFSQLGTPPLSIGRMKRISYGQCRPEWQQHPQSRLQIVPHKSGMNMVPMHSHPIGPSTTCLLYREGPQCVLLLQRWKQHPQKRPGTGDHWQIERGCLLVCAAQPGGLVSLVITWLNSNVCTRQSDTEAEMVANDHHIAISNGHRTVS